MDHQRLKPAETGGDASDLYNLGYVQNVIMGQVLARVEPLEHVASPDPRFILDKPVLPAGPNTLVDPAQPAYLLARNNGYVFYHEGLITVKNLLNVRSDVSFHTGHIFFVGDVAVHGSVRAGFEVQANNVLVKGMVEGGTVRARRNLAITGGGRGGAGEHCVLDAGGALRSNFIEKLEARACGNILVEKNCLHANLYGGANVVVQGRAHGGAIHAYGSLLVREQLGNVAAVPTRVFLGYDPMCIRRLERVEARISSLSETITHLTAVAGHLPPDASAAARKLMECRENKEHLMAVRANLWKSLHLDEQFSSRCLLVAYGKVYPGVEVAIGRAYLSVESLLENVAFSLEEDEIVVKTAPPAKDGSA